MGANRPQTVADQSVWGAGTVCAPVRHMGERTRLVAWWGGTGQDLAQFARSAGTMPCDTMSTVQCTATSQPSGRGPAMNLCVFCVLCVSVRLYVCMYFGRMNIVGERL